MTEGTNDDRVEIACSTSTELRAVAVTLRAGGHSQTTHILIVMDPADDEGAAAMQRLQVKADVPAGGYFVTGGPIVEVLKRIPEFSGLGLDVGTPSSPNVWRCLVIARGGASWCEVVLSLGNEGGGDA
jgi:hypothetical protein